MTRDDIIRMAHEAGWSGVFVIEWAKQPDEHPVEKSLPVPVTMEQIERFAALVATAERDRLEPAFKQLEALMQVRETQPNKPCCLAEREACAKIVETHQCKGWGILSAAIRARGKE